MAKIADPDKMRAGKLDGAWVTAVWVGRVDKSNEHLLLTTKGCIRSRVVRRIPDGNQASYHAEVQGGSAEMLRNATVRPGEPPRPSRGRPRKDGSPAQARTTTSGQETTRDDPMPGSSDDHLRQPTTETDVIQQRDFFSKHFGLIHLADLGVLKTFFEKKKSSFLSFRSIFISLHFLFHPLSSFSHFSSHTETELTRPSDSINEARPCTMIH